MTRDMRHITGHEIALGPVQTIAINQKTRGSVAGAQSLAVIRAQIKFIRRKFWKAVKYCNHREKYQIPNWMIRYLLEMSPKSRVTCLFVYPVLVNCPHSRHVCVEKLTQSNLSRYYNESLHKTKYISYLLVAGPGADEPRLAHRVVPNKDALNKLRPRLLVLHHDASRMTEYHY